jgi:hypothetical protein
MKGKAMAKQKRLNRGMVVEMNDGWRGKVEQDAGETVVCIRDGERPNDWLRGYRAFSRRCMTLIGNKGLVNWKSTAAVSRSHVDREQSRRDVVVHLERAQRERSWEGAPD